MLLDSFAALPLRVDELVDKRPKQLVGACLLFDALGVLAGVEGPQRADHSATIRRAIEEDNARDALERLRRDQERKAREERKAQLEKEKQEKADKKGAKRRKTESKDAKQSAADEKESKPAADPNGPVDMQDEEPSAGRLDAAKAAALSNAEAIAAPNPWKRVRFHMLQLSHHGTLISQTFAAVAAPNQKRPPVSTPAAATAAVSPPAHLGAKMRARPVLAKMSCSFCAEIRPFIELDVSPVFAKLIQPDAPSESADALNTDDLVRSFNERREELLRLLTVPRSLCVAP